MANRMRGRALVVMGVLAFFAGGAAGQEVDRSRTVPIDPVEAVDGREIPGEPGISSEHRGYRYLFASRENVTRFLMNPDRYEVMWAGACGRMGPLSGKGRPEWYAVHDGRVFIFASEQCRQTFVADPALCVETDEPAPTVMHESTEKARALIERGVEAMGGAAKVDGLTAWREYRSEKAADDPAREDTVTLTIVFPDAGHLRETWGEHEYARHIRGETGTFVSSRGEETMVAAQVSAMRRELAHHPMVILRARNRADFVAGMAEPGELDGVKLERVVVNFDGATTTLGIDPVSGRVITTEFRGRGKRALLGDVRRVYCDFREAGGFMVPYARTTTWNGEAMGAAPIELDAIEVNPVIDAALFGDTAG